MTIESALRENVLSSTRHPSEWADLGTFYRLLDKLRVEGFTLDQIKNSFEEIDFKGSGMIPMHELIHFLLHPEEVPKIVSANSARHLPKGRYALVDQFVFSFGQGDRGHQDELFWSYS